MEVEVLLIIGFVFVGLAMAQFLSSIAMGFTGFCGKAEENLRRGVVCFIIGIVILVLGAMVHFSTQ